MSLAFALEIVLMLAAGMGASRSFVADPEYASLVSHGPDARTCLRLLGGGFLPAVALVGWLGVWVE